jgi:Elongation factor Tu GTP binding domain
MTGRTVAWRMLAVLLALSGLAGCRSDPAEQKAAPSAEQAATAFNLAILGDATRIDLLTAIATAHEATVQISGLRKVAEIRREAALMRFLSSADDNIATQAALAWEADLLLLAVDATQGPLPVHREHALLSRQMAVPTVVIAFTKSHAVDDPELLELEELEMRELLNKYGLPGDTAPCLFDHHATKTPARSRAAKGPMQIMDALGAIAKKRKAPDFVREEKLFKVGVYALVPQEAFTRDVATAVKTGPARALVGNESVAADVAAPREIAPGENGEIDIVFARPLRVAEGQRFLLLNKDHVSAAGFFFPKNGGSR